MTTRRRIRSSKVLNSFQHEKFLSNDFKLKPSFIEEKVEAKFSLKVSLESLLLQIKTSAMDNISYKSIKTNYAHNTKELLLLLKDNLSSMLKEKNKLYKYSKEKNHKKKTNIQKLLYTDSEDKEKNEIENKTSETKLLRILNFQIENEIESTDFLINRKNQIISEIKSSPFFITENNEIWGNNSKNLSAVLEILHEDINLSRKIFIDIVNKKADQNMEIKSLSMKKDYYQEIKNNMKNLSNDDYIIREELNENSLDNSYRNSNENNKRNILKLQSNDSLNKKIYELNQEKFIRRRLIFSKTVSPRIINNIYNLKNNLINKIKPQKVKHEETILKSFNSSLDSEYLTSQKNDMFRKSVTNFHETFIPGSNENSNTDNSNNKSNLNESNSESLTNDINIKIKQNEEEDYIFSLSEKE